MCAVIASHVRQMVSTLASEDNRLRGGDSTLTTLGKQKKLNLPKTSTWGDKTTARGQKQGSARWQQWTRTEMDHGRSVHQVGKVGNEGKQTLPDLMAWRASSAHAPLGVGRGRHFCVPPPAVVRRSEPAGSAPVAPVTGCVYPLRCRGLGSKPTAAPKPKATPTATHQRRYR